MQQVFTTTMASPCYVSAALAIAVGLVCYCSMAECKYTPAQWYANYELIFGTSSKVQLGESSIKGIILFLHNGATEPVDKYKQSIVDFFHDAGLPKSEHCSSDWVERLGKKSKVFVEIGNRAIPFYSELIRKKTMEICGKQLVEWAYSGRLGLSRDEMAKLDAAAQNIRDPKRKGIGAQKLAEMFSMDALSSYADFKKAWANGPCSKVLVSLINSSTEFRRVVDYVKGLNVYLRFEGANNILSVLETCKELKSDKALKDIYDYM